MRVAIVGPCASGKSTLAAELSTRGIDAYAVAQEHSDIIDLWARQQPGRLIYLDVSLSSLRRRRSNPFWPRWVYERQLERLADARKHADLVVDTNVLDHDAVVALVVQRLLT